MKPRDFTSEQDAAGRAQLVATMPLLQFYIATRKNYQFLDSETKYGDFCHKERKETQRLCVLCVRILCERCVEKRSTGCFNAKNAEETQRPQRLCVLCVGILCGLCVGKRGTGCFNAKNAEGTQRPQRLCVLCVRILCERCVEKRSTGRFDAKNAEGTQRPQRLCELCAAHSI